MTREDELREAVKAEKARASVSCTLCMDEVCSNLNRTSKCFNCGVQGCVLTYVCGICAEWTCFVCRARHHECCDIRSRVGELRISMLGMWQELQDARKKLGEVEQVGERPWIVRKLDDLWTRVSSDEERT